MESSISNNPLAKHFRQPAIYLKLPSEGRYYPDGALELGATGEIPIYPMTVKDELALKTPDALMNGASIHDMIRSCCPSIKDPWAIPSVDLDAILIAIRLASYGSDMDITSSCTKCQTDNDHTVDLRQILDGITVSKSYDKKHYEGGLTFEIQPQKLKDYNISSIVTFEQRKVSMLIENSDMPEDDKKKEFLKSFQVLADLNVKVVIDGVKSITTEDGTVVTERNLIEDFLNNCDRKTYDMIKNLITDAVAQTKLPPMHVNCNECQAEYDVNIEFNQSNFFV